MPRVTLPSSVSLDVQDTGGERAGCAVVLVHGFTGGKWYWRQVLERLEPQRRVIAVDLKGHGESDKPGPDQQPYSIPQYCQEISQVIRVLGVRAFVLVGHSMGGMIALTYPLSGIDGGLQGIVVVTSTGRLRMPEGFGEDYRPFVEMLASGEMSEDTMRAFNDLGFAPSFAAAHPDIVEENYRESMKTPHAVKGALLQSMFEDYGQADLERFAKIECPALLISASQDALTPAEDTDALGMIIPECRTKLLEGVGHSVPLEAPEVLAALIENFAQPLD